WRLQWGWPGSRSLLASSGMADRSWARRRRTSIPAPTWAGGPYRGAARRGPECAGTTTAPDLSRMAAGATGDRLVFAIRGRLGGGVDTTGATPAPACGGSPRPYSAVSGRARSGPGGGWRRSVRLAGSAELDQRTG